VVLGFAEKEVKLGTDRVVLGAQMVMESWVILDVRNALLIGGAIIAARGSMGMAGIEFEHCNGTRVLARESTTLPVPDAISQELGGGETLGGKRGGPAGATALAVSSVSGKTQRPRTLS
jgi:hypothetical protein